ncbi:MAG: DEAD/DEAH box helicase [Bdellovibrionota bacterium]|nr:DEAD/DEAH box helicase [Deltaproteobacteria bacterium]
MTTFNDFHLSPLLLEALKTMEYTTPTPIQQESIPLILSKKDILASAQTGTGKTGAFCIPIIEHLGNNLDDNALILTPTRELAAQIFDVSKQLTQTNKKIRTGLFIGGVPITKQMSHLKSNPRLLIATPGRVMDLYQRGVLNLKAITHLVLDETDRMLDMGFGEQIADIVRNIPKDRQTLLFSATIPRQIENLSRKYLREPVRISMEVASKPADNLIQDVMMVREVLKYESLIEQVNTRKGSMIVFTKTKRGADKVARKMYEEGFNARAIHGDLKQNTRQRILQLFRDQKCRILVATDVAARGIDVSHVEHVINYDLPQSPQDYIHRIGRTARAGAKGHALSLVSPRDEHLWKAIERFLASDGTEDQMQAPSSRRRSRGRRPRGKSQTGPKKKHQHQFRVSKNTEDRSNKRHQKKTSSKKPEKPAREPHKAPAKGAKKSATKHRKTDSSRPKKSPPTPWGKPTEASRKKGPKRKGPAKNKRR